MPLILIFFFLLKGGTPANSPTPVAQPSPALTVSFERQSVRQRDCVNVELLMSNDSDVELTNTSLEVSGPSFFRWFEGPCDEDDKETRMAFGVKARPTLSVGAIAARSPLKQPVHFHTGASINVGEYNVLFRVLYEWKKENQTVRSFVSAEKTVKVNFLGSESVAGIPLALAGFIVPGLIFWLIIKGFGAPWSVDALGNQMIYSVMVSIALVMIGAWVGYGDVSSGISIEKLTTLAGEGAGLGLVVGFTDLMIRRRKRQRQITRGDREFNLLWKILELPSANRLEKPVITLKSGEEYSGSLAARTNVLSADGTPGGEILSLLGSYKIDWNKIRDPQLKARMRGFIEARKWQQFVTLARKHEAIDSIQQIELKNSSGGYNAISEPFKQWEAADVASSASGSGTWTAETLDTN